MVRSISGVTQVQSTDSLNKNTLLKVEPFRLNIMPPSTGVQFYSDGIIFLSTSVKEGKMLPNHTSFGRADAYYVSYKDTVPGNHVPFSLSSPFEGPCEDMTFNSDFTVMYFTKKISAKSPEKIYRARYQASRGGKMDWVSGIEPIRMCSDKSTYLHPSLSADGQMMVFASNRQGSVGGLDIFVAHSDGSDWSTPENAGTEINTTGDEFSPFLDKENNLFFSSNGLPGLGGSDIYFSKYNGKGWEKPFNLTDKINSENDEIAFTMDRNDGRSVFFTRRMKSGKGPLQLYRVTFKDQTAVSKLTNLSNAFKYIAMGNLVPAPSAPVLTTAAKVDQQVSQQVQPAIQPEKKTVVEKTPPATKPISKPAQTQKQQETVQTPSKTPVTQPSATKSTVVYRVQFTSTSKSKGSYEITVGGKKYKTFEYLYKGAYRSCAGEFSTRNPAIILQRALKQEGFPDAFVVAFVNNVRSTDPALFK